MKKRTIALIVLALVVIVGIALVWAMVAAFGGGGGKVPSKTILEVDLEVGAIEYAPEDPIAKVLLEGTPRTRDYVDALVRAAEDERVVGLIARIGESGMGFAQIQEIRDAVIAFRESGKPAIAWAETFGEVGPGNSSYYLATAFDEIHLQPSGDVGLTGFHLESPFFAGTLEKLGLTPRLDHRYEYKNAMNTFTETGFTDAHREAMSTLMNSFFDSMVSDVAEARELGEEEVRQLIDRGPFLGQEAVDAGLVDALAYRDVAYDEIRRRAGEDAELLYLGEYLSRAGRPHDEGTRVALIYGVGMVVRGASEYDPVADSVTMGSDTVAAAFRAAVDDEKVKAILFRVDSPGGSYVASDAIWREVVRAREAGKPVIVSMGEVAASGGYFVAMPADKIVAQPGTVTGSIGVLGGKLLTSEMWNKLGVSWDSVQTSDHADMWTGLEDYDETEWQRFQSWLDRVYEDFTAKVAEGRGMPIEEVKELAKGRIWSGTDALDNGLVDALGGVETALELAREAAGLEPGADVELALFPRPQTPFQALFGEGPASSEDRAAAVAFARVMERFRPLVHAAQRVGLIEPRPGVLTVPPEAVPAP